MKKQRHKHRKPAPRRVDAAPAGAQPAARRPDPRRAPMAELRRAPAASHALPWVALPASRGATAGTRTATAPPADDRGLLTMILLPVVLLAGMLTVGQALRPTQRLIEDIALRSPVPVARPPAPAVEIATPAPVYPPAAPPMPLVEVVVPPPLFGRQLALIPPPVPAPPPASAAEIAALIPAPALWPPAVPPMPVDVALWTPPPAGWRLPPSPPDVPADVVIALPGPAATFPPAAPRIEPDVAAWTPPVPGWRLERLPLPVPPPPAEVETVCRPAPGGLASLTQVRSAPLPPVPALSPEAFGTALAAAAMDQTRDFVVYSARYQRIAYPQGDLPALFGACSDVVVRAYRALGVDLQRRVQEMRAGDPSIDHRRTETLRAYFARHGESLAVSPYPEDYRPGDIVTYYRPFSRVSRSHIAIVTDRIAPSGRPMIVHNRGFGVQIEDALFVDRITGHYRFHPRPSPPDAVAAPRRGLAAPAAATATTALAAGEPGARTDSPPAAMRKPLRPGTAAQGRSSAPGAIPTGASALGMAPQPRIR